MRFPQVKVQLTKSLSLLIRFHHDEKTCGLAIVDKKGNPSKRVTGYYLLTGDEACYFVNGQAQCKSVNIINGFTVFNRKGVRVKLTR